MYSHLNPDTVLETRLPSKEKFFNTLMNCHISQADFEFINKFYDDLAIPDIKTLVLEYNKSDVLLLADCFLTFRQLLFEMSGLDCARYVTLPSFGEI